MCNQLFHYMTLICVLFILRKTIFEYNHNVRSMLRFKESVFEEYKPRMRQFMCITGQLTRLELYSKFKNIVIPLLLQEKRVDIILALDESGNKRVNQRFDFKDSYFYEKFRDLYASNSSNNLGSLWEIVVSDILLNMGVSKVNLSTSNNLLLERNEYLLHTTILQQEYTIYFNNSQTVLGFYPFIKVEDFSVELPDSLVKIGDKIRKHSLMHEREKFHLVSIQL